MKDWYYDTQAKCKGSRPSISTFCARFGWWNNKNLIVSSGICLLRHV
jgi:hypothetical protein